MKTMSRRRKRKPETYDISEEAFQRHLNQPDGPPWTDTVATFQNVETGDDDEQVTTRVFSHWFVELCKRWDTTLPTVE
jgi:hypothetical protein